jgi:hypothetical protein
MRRLALILAVLGTLTFSGMSFTGPQNAEAAWGNRAMVRSHVRSNQIRRHQHRQLHATMRHNRQLNRQMHRTFVRGAPNYYGTVR